VELILKKENIKVVFTNGCFDILHIGHVKYLQAARELGDILIVGLNSDASVTQLKGPSRPINSFIDRATVLSSLRFVDEVVEFNEPTPLNLIKKLKPDVLVKGGDYQKEDIIGYDFVTSYGGIVVTEALIPGKSTSIIIEKVQKWQNS
jgi:D-beta-D-heptose 7-phosphate kinase/D-beta-D-heptose 1-phosphate adenosyltransferase